MASSPAAAAATTAAVSSPAWNSVLLGGVAHCNPAMPRQVHCKSAAFGIQAVAASVEAYHPAIRFNIHARLDLWDVFSLLSARVFVTNGKEWSYATVTLIQSGVNGKFACHANVLKILWYLMSWTEHSEQNKKREKMDLKAKMFIFCKMWIMWWLTVAGCDWMALECFSVGKALIILNIEFTKFVTWHTRWNLS